MPSKSKQIFFFLVAGNINEEEFVQIFVQIFDGEDTGKPKTEYKEQDFAWIVFQQLTFPVL